MAIAKQIAEVCASGVQGRIAGLLWNPDPANAAYRQIDERFARFASELRLEHTDGSGKVYAIVAAPSAP